MAYLVQKNWNVIFSFLYPTLRWRKTGTLRTRIRFRWGLSQTRLSGRYQWGTHWQWKRDIYSKFVIFYNFLYVDSSLVTAILLDGSIIGRANNDAWWSHRSHSWTINSASALQTWKIGFSIYLLIQCGCLAWQTSSPECPWTQLLHLESQGST